MAPDRYAFRFTGSEALRDKLRQAQDLLRHAVPSGDPAEIFDRALTLLLEKLARKRSGATEGLAGKSARTRRPTRPGSRHVPAESFRAVWQKNGGRCAYVGPGGRRCTARGGLEVHHLEPYGIGGETTLDNLELRCQAHNAYESLLFYGASAERWRHRPRTVSRKVEGRKADGRKADGPAPRSPIVAADGRGGPGTATPNESRGREHSHAQGRRGARSGTSAPVASRIT